MLWCRNKPLDSRENAKPRVLVVGPLFPKGGGEGMVNKILLTSCLSDQFEMVHLDTGRTKAGEGKESKIALINFYYYFRQLSKLLWILLLQRPQIMHQSVTDQLALWKESTFMLLARILGVKVVAHMHGPVLDLQLRQSSPWKKRLMIAALSVPHVIIALSEYWRTFFTTEVSSHLRVIVVPNCIDQSIAQAMDRVESENKEQGCLVLFLGWLSMRKGLPDALRAASLVRRQVPEVRFVFAGSLEPGSHKDTLERACEVAGLEGNVSFPGLVIGDEKLALLSEASIFILPSYNENLPVAILEAMAMGLPIVTTLVGGIPDMIKDGSGGFLIQPGDYEALAERIVHLAKDPGLRRRMGQANVARVRQEYHPRIFFSRIASLYKQLLAAEYVAKV